MRNLTSLLLPFGLLASTTIFAEELPVYDENAPSEIPMSGFYFSLGKANFDSQTAREEGIGDSATMLRLMWEGQKSQLVYGAGMGIYLYDDKAEFSQLVEDSFGDVDNAESSATGITAIGEIGYAKPLNAQVSMEAVGGVELMLSSDRSIGNCSNCYSEDIDIGGGLYVMPRIRFSSAGTFNFSLSYQHFLSGDIESTVAAHFSWRQ